jgi:hypothetical protein
VDPEIQIYGKLAIFEAQLDSKIELKGLVYWKLDFGS